ncbi:MAG: hypothetical protein FJ285_04015 [Planctomycetes bacterium]|nr:hypothetical protein [Planctomycetota bacterium]
MSRSSKSSLALKASALLLVVWIALSASLSIVPLPIRIDLTQGSVYTLSPGVRSMLASLDEPVRLELFFTAEGSRDLPQIRNHALRVQEFLESLVASSNGKVDLKIVDPQPFSEAEDTAKAAGIAPITADGAGRTLMLGLLVSGATDQRECLPYLNPQEEAFLEYDVSRAIISVSRAQRAKVALVTGLPMDSSFDPRSQRMTPPWQVMAQLRNLFDVEVVQPSAEKLPDQFDALVVAHPKGLSEPLLRAIDAYALAGGRMLVFLDPFCESDSAPMGPGGFGSGGTPSDFGSLPSSWGIAWKANEVVADRTFAQRVRARSDTGLATVDFVAWLNLNKEAISRDDPAFGVLQTLIVMSAGSLDRTEGSKLEMVPLVRSSADSMLIDGSKLGPFADPSALLRDFKADGAQRVIAARYTGIVRSAFPPAAEPVEGTVPASIVVVADADMLRDETWIQEERLGNLSLGWRAFADNGSLLLNTVEQLSGNQALLGLRARGSSQRPFDVVRALQRDAEQRFRSREDELQKRISETQQRITSMQQQKTPDQMLLLTPEQQAQLERLQQEVLDARRELRQVQFSLREDVEALGHRLMLLNVLAWPVIVAVAAVFLGVRRRSQSTRTAA